LEELEAEWCAKAKGTVPESDEGCGRKIVPHLTVAARDVVYPCCSIVNDDHVQHLWRFGANSFDLIIADPPYGKRFMALKKHHANRLGR